MRQDAAKRVGADVTPADVLMAIGARAERRLRIVGVDQLYILHPEDAIRVAYGLLEPCFAPDIESGGEQMAGIEAVADRQSRDRRGPVPNRAQFFEARAEVASTARRAFDQQHDPTA